MNERWSVSAAAATAAAVHVVANNLKHLTKMNNFAERKSGLVSRPIQIAFCSRHERIAF